ncbi:MAG: nitroreductase family protein [Actinomycetota bacterium]|jgi:nitroreductase|nr:nitroreductase family protein [Actinomycetota bacterium]MEC9395792.1 nitroreductase family protein [Actinomycetota bacterium]MED6328500.1 nitroreductase family protein [Actinomycetota bacterium]
MKFETGTTRGNEIGLLDGLMTNRAMRRYSGEAVSDEDVWTCLHAAVQAPSGGNIQPYQFVIVQDPELKQGLAEIYRRGWRRYEPAIAPTEFPNDAVREGWEKNNRATVHLAENLEHVPVIVLLLMPSISMTIHDDEGPMPVGPTHASVYPAIQNFMLAARSLGLGTAMTTLHRIYEDDVRQLIGIPDRYEVLALLPLGHPTGRWGVAPRHRGPEKITSWDRFGEKRSR